MNREEAKEDILDRSNLFRDLDWDLQNLLQGLVNENIDEIFDQHDKETLEAAIKYAELVEKYDELLKKYNIAADRYNDLRTRVLNLNE